MNFMKIAWRDISSIFKNKFIRYSVAAIIIVPVLYSLLYLYAFWDPYAKIQQMPVAFVNMDKGTTNDGENVNYGKDIEDNLKENNQIGWKFVSLDDAKSGVKGEGYYAMFVIPEDFSQKSLSAKDGKPIQPSIIYTSNDKKSFLASLINEKVMSELKIKIVKNISEEYTKVTFNKLFEVKDGMVKASDGSLKLKDGLNEAYDGTTKLEEGALKLRDGSIALGDGANKLSNGAASLRDGLGEAKIGSQKLSFGINQFTSKAGGILNGQIPNILTPESIIGVKTLMKDASAIKNIDTSAFAMMPMLLNDKNINALKKISVDFKAVDLKALNDLPQIKELTKPQNVKNIGKLMIDTDKISKIDLDKLQPLMGMLQNSDKITKLLNDSQQLEKVDLSSVGSMLNEQKNGAIQFIGASNTLNASNNKEMLEGAIKSNSNLSLEQKTKLIALIEGYSKLTTDTATNMQSSVAKLGGIQASMVSLVNLQKELKDNDNLINGVKSTLSKENVDYLNVVLPQLVTMKQDLALNESNLNQVKILMNGLNTNGDLKQALDKISVLQNDIEGAKPIIENLQKAMTPEQIDKLKSSPALISQLMAMQKDLKNNQKLLEVAESALTDKNIGMAKDLITAIPQIKDGVNQLALGSLALTSGVSKLYDGSDMLANGLSELNGKVPDLKDGTQKLYDGTHKLNDGMVKLTDGSKELSDKLNDGRDKLVSNLKNDSATMGAYVSEPIKIEKNAINPIENYGTGFAPYFLPLSLWVGALMMFFVITDKTDEDINSGPIGLVLGKFLSYAFIGTIQAILASVVVMLLGLRPDNVVLYVLFNVFMSFVFIAIIQSLVFLLGQIGRLLSIVLLILQLTACAGTFPYEVLPKFFKVLNPFMPFTYCVSALREVISGVDYKVLAKDVSVLVVVMVVFLIISVIMKEHADKVQQKVGEQREAAALV